MRLPALIAGLCVIPATYAVAKTIYDEYTGLASALAVSILPGAILYSSPGRGYSLVALFTLLTLWLAHSVRHDKNRFAWALLVILSALGFYAVSVMLFPFGIVFTWLFLENPVSHPTPYASRGDFLKRWFIAGVSSATLVLLLYAPIFIYTGADKVFANPWVRPEAYDGYLSMIPGRAAAVWHEWTGEIPPVLTALLLLGFLLSLILHRRTARQRFPLQGGAILWIAELFSSPGLSECRSYGCFSRHRS